MFNKLFFEEIVPKIEMTSAINGTSKIDALCRVLIRVLAENK